MGWFGSLIGSTLGKIGSKILPIPGVDGGTLGGAIGNLAPFKKGGKVHKMKGMKLQRVTKKKKKAGKPKK